MRLSVLGSGYVGTTIAACFADIGHEVVNIDVDQQIVDAINSGESPIHEAGLYERISSHTEPGGTGRLVATTDYRSVCDTGVTFLALPTPARENGSIDLSIMEAAAEQLGDTLATKSEDHTIIVKSTVIPGTTMERVKPALEKHSGQVAGDNLHLGMNPEFLRMGSAVEDFLNPDKLVFGARENRVFETLAQVYDPLLDQADDPSVIRTGISEAEMIKYANNIILASKISMINDIGNICKEFGVDTYEVADAVGADDHINRAYLDSGLGWGGSCFPKDIGAITAAAYEKGYQPAMLEAALEVNNRQPERFLELLDENEDVTGERVAVLGLSFKPGTDDIRGSRAKPVIKGLLQRDAKPVGYDPAAIEKMESEFPNIYFADSASEALQNAIACLVVTDWPEFTELDKEFEGMKQQLVVDGRHCIEPRDNMKYVGLTW